VHLRPRSLGRQPYDSRRNSHKLLPEFAMDVNRQGTLIAIAGGDGVKIGCALVVDVGEGAEEAIVAVAGTSLVRLHAASSTKKAEALTNGVPAGLAAYTLVHRFIRNCFGPGVASSDPNFRPTRCRINAALRRRRAANEHTRRRSRRLRGSPSRRKRRLSLDLRRTTAR